MRKSICVFFVCLLLTLTAATGLAKETPNDTQTVSETETTTEAPAVPENEAAAEGPSEPEPEQGKPLGDADGSGTVDANDARAILRTSVSLEFPDGETLPYLDMDHSLTVTSADARLALRVSVGLEVPEKHTYTVTVEKEARCKENGKLGCVCETCGKKFSMRIPMRGHRYVYQSGRDATCTADGKLIFVCTVCGAKTAQRSKATGHSYEYQSGSGATCTADGKLIFVCTACGAKTAQLSKATGHSWTAATETTPKTCAKCGLKETGWTAVNGKYYYFFNDGTLAVNRIVGSYFVDKNGARADSPAVAAAVAFVNAHSSANASPAKRLSDCYTYICGHSRYKRSYGIPTGADIPSYAESFLKRSIGNCYSYASAVAYIAAVLGFDARVETGELSRYGGRFSAHGWTWIKINKSWYIFDADVQTFYKRNCYMKSEKNYPFRLRHGKTYTAYHENGTIVWK